MTESTQLFGRTVHLETESWRTSDLPLGFYRLFGFVDCAISNRNYINNIFLFITCCNNNCSPRLNRNTSVA